MFAVVLPETVDIAGVITTCCLLFGGTVAVAIGGFVAFLLTKKGINWFNRALSSDAAEENQKRQERLAAWADVVDKD